MGSGDAIPAHVCQGWWADRDSPRRSCQHGRPRASEVRSCNRAGIGTGSLLLTLLPGKAIIDHSLSTINLLYPGPVQMSRPLCALCRPASGLQSMHSLPDTTSPKPAAGLLGCCSRQAVVGRGLIPGCPTNIRGGCQLVLGFPSTPLVLCRSWVG
jgi:hypothetical protein